jgi:hypothetical protein
LVDAVALLCRQASDFAMARAVGEIQQAVVRIHRVFGLIMRWGVGQILSEGQKNPKKIMAVFEAY